MRKVIKTRWWLMDCSLPQRNWARLRVWNDGTCDLLDSDDRLHPFESEAAAVTFLREDEFVPLDQLLDEVTYNRVGPSPLVPPEPARADCPTCGSSWTEGLYGPECDTCGGGAMDRPCPVCGGICGRVWRRAVMDSQDSGLAHWIGHCGLAARTQG